MQPVKKLLDRLNGYQYRQEYLCLADEPFTQPLYAYTMSGDAIENNITNNHLFVGYSPLIFALDIFKNELEIRFTHDELSSGQILKANDALAWLKLRRIPAPTNDIAFYEGAEAHHRFIPAFNQFVNRLNNRLYQQKAGNVYLDSTLYPQVQVAYAIPRGISLLTLALPEGFNLFPTDLHGPTLSGAEGLSVVEGYIISLRHGGLACKQVQEAGKIVVSRVQPHMYKEVYKLGKNHMQPIKPANAFPFSKANSKSFNLPLPQNTVGYTELELQTSFDHGIHRVLLFNIVNQHVEPGSQSLRHIHNSYATWRFKHGFPGNYLLR